MGAVDRVVGVAFGAFLGALVALVVVGISSAPGMVGLAQALFLGLCIWGWYGGAYALGRVVAWVRRK